MMHHSVNRSDSTWHRTLVALKQGTALEPVRQKLNAIFLAIERERSKGFTNLSKQSIDNYLHQTVLFEPAASGVSNLQHDNRRSLIALGVLVALVLFITSTNVANLMTAQAATRARELALRVSRGARIVGPPASHPWGLRDFRVLDLEGNRITFAQTFE
jgi:hypothetical protein